MVQPGVDDYMTLSEASFSASRPSTSVLFISCILSINDRYVLLMYQLLKILHIIHYHASQHLLLQGNFPSKIIDSFSYVFFLKYAWMSLNFHVTQIVAEFGELSPFDLLRLSLELES